MSLSTVNSICFIVLSKLLSLTFSLPFFRQCVTVTWHDLASSRRRASTSVQQTISVCTVHAVTAATASSQERWSLLWDALTTPSALSAVSAGTHAHAQATTDSQCYTYKLTVLHINGQHDNIFSEIQWCHFIIQFMWYINCKLVQFFIFGKYRGAKNQWAGLNVIRSCNKVIWFVRCTACHWAAQLASKYVKSEPIDRTHMQF